MDTGDKEAIYQSPDWTILGCVTPSPQRDEVAMIRWTVDSEETFLIARNPQPVVFNLRTREVRSIELEQTEPGRSLHVENINWSTP